MRRRTYSASHLFRCQHHAIRFGELLNRMKTTLAGPAVGMLSLLCMIIVSTGSKRAGREQIRGYVEPGETPRISTSAWWWSLTSDGAAAVPTFSKPPSCGSRKVSWCWKSKSPSSARAALRAGGTGSFRRGEPAGGRLSPARASTCAYCEGQLLIVCGRTGPPHPHIWDRLTYVDTFVRLATVRVGRIFHVRRLVNVIRTRAMLFMFRKQTDTRPRFEQDASTAEALQRRIDAIQFQPSKGSQRQPKRSARRASAS